MKIRLLADLPVLHAEELQLTAGKTHEVMKLQFMGKAEKWEIIVWISGYQGELVKVEAPEFIFIENYHRIIPYHVCSIVLRQTAGALYPHQKVPVCTCTNCTHALTPELTVNLMDHIKPLDKTNKCPLKGTKFGEALLRADEKTQKELEGRGGS
jgi:hypothetical protein